MSLRDSAFRESQPVRPASVERGKEDEHDVRTGQDTMYM